LQQLAEIQAEHERKLAEKESETLHRVREVSVEANKQNEENQSQV